MNVSDAACFFPSGRISCYQPRWCANWQEEWDDIVAQFHDAFANTPEEEVVLQDIEEVLAEVRQQRA